MAIVNLLAGKDFRSGDLGYATGGRAGPLSTGFVPADGQMVRALEDVHAGENGNFVEIELVEKASK